MGIESIVGAGASLLGSAMSSNSSQDAAKSAANASADATNQATALQKQIYEQNRSDQQPWRTAGGNALTRLSQGMGLSSPTNTPDRNAIYNQLKGNYTTTSGGGSGTGTYPQFKDISQLEQGLKNPSLYSGGLSMLPNPNYEGSIGSIDPLTERVNLLSAGYQSPTTSIDNDALNKAVDEEYARQMAASSGYSSDPFYGSLMKKFSMSDYQEDPGYQFRLSEGMKGLDRSAAARGGLQSGAALKAAANYSQNAASNEYGNAYNRYNQDQGNQFNRLASVAGLGQTANSANQTSAMNYGNNVSNLLTSNGDNQANAALSAGASRGASYAGIGNALGGLNWGKSNGSGIYGGGYWGGAGSMNGNGSVQGNSDYYWDL